MPNHDIRAAADQSATGRNTTAMPTPAQLAAGNYRKGRVSIHGLSIAIENPIGTFREGVGADGKPWRTRIAADYGYFAGTRGADGDGVDVFVGDFIDSGDVWVINQIDPATGAFDEHKVMLGFGSEALARAAYTESYDRDWKGLGSMVRITVPQLRWWLKRGSMLSPLEDAGSLPAMPASGSMLQPVRWSADAEPVGKSLGRVLYEMQLDDVGDDLLTDPMTMADLLTDPDITSHMVLDALVSEVGMLQHRAEQLMSVMQAAGRAVKPQQLEVGEPVRLRGTMQVPVIFGMSDGQTLSIWFHNPDTTPAKLTPMDTLVSARWLINKKDVTIAVAPEKGQDLKPREVARRIMALIEKNSAAFARANAKAAETAQKIDGLKAEIDGLQAELAGLNEKIARAEAVRVDRAAKAKAVPVDPTKEAAHPPSADPGTIVATFPLPEDLEWRVVVGNDGKHNAVFFDTDAGDSVDIRVFAGKDSLANATNYAKGQAEAAIRMASPPDAAAPTAPVATAPTFTVQVPDGISSALAADMNNQEHTAAKLARDASARGLTREEKSTRKSAAIAAQAELSAMRLKKFAAEDLAIEAIVNRVPTIFNEMAALFPKTQAAIAIMMAKEVVDEGANGVPLETDQDDLSTPDGRYMAGKRAFQRGVPEGNRPRLIGVGDWIRGYEDAKIASANAGEAAPAPAAAPAAAGTKPAKKTFTYAVKPADGGFVIESNDGGGIVMAGRPNGPGILNTVPPRKFASEDQARDFMRKKGMTEAAAAAPAPAEPPASDPIAEPPAADLFGDAHPEAMTPEGAESKVKTAKGTEVLTGYSVIEADRLITSHDPATGDANPAFPPELQPRDRGRDASIAWVRKTANDLDPDLLGKSRRADSGAPIVGPDGVVESGNGRTMAVVLAYQTGRADDYRAWLEDEANYFGLSAEKVKAMRRPVLVRIRTSEVDRAAFAVEANQDDKLAMTATEVAKADAGRLTDDVVALMTEDGDLTTAANVPFLSAFLRTLGDAEAARYSTSDGKPTASLIARVQAAIFAKAYQDDRLLELTADVAKPEIANIVKALNHAAPEFIQAAAMDPEATSAATGKLTDAVEKSLNQQAVDALLGASNVIRQAKDAGQTVEEFVKQSGLFGDIDPDVAAMAVFISKNNRSAKRMGEAFKAMATFIKGELQRRQTADMFGDGDPVDFKDIVAAANRELERMYGPGVETIGLFDRPADPPPVADPAPEPAEAAPQTAPEDLDPAAAVDAVYRFDDATDEFKDYLSESVGESEYSPFNTAVVMDKAVNENGGTVSWAMADGAILDSAGADGDDDGEEGDPDVMVLDGDFPGHPFRGNQFKRARMDSHHAGRASREARRADRTAKGHDRTLNYVHNAAAQAHKRAAKGAKGKSLAYHSKMAVFHAKRAKHHADKLDGKIVLDSVAGEVWPDDGIAVFDYAGDGAAQGVIRKDGKILGRAVIDDDGKAMIYVDAAGAKRVRYASGLDARWSDDDAEDMVKALFTVLQHDQVSTPDDADPPGGDGKLRESDMIALGAKPWTARSGEVRYYFNSLPSLYGLKVSRYKTGNISSASLDGHDISNGDARKILAQLDFGKLWWSAATGEFASSKLSEDVAAKIEAAILAKAEAIRTPAKPEQPTEPEPSSTTTPMPVNPPADPPPVADPAPEPAEAAPQTAPEDLDPAAAVDAVYRFDDATDEFKDYMSESVGDTDYSPFATASEIDQAVRANGGTVSWSMVVGAILDSVAEMGDGWDPDDPSEYEGIFDSAGSGEPQGVIRKGRRILGRAVIAGDGKAMIYVGKAGATRVKLGNGAPAAWGEPVPFMVTALFVMASELVVAEKSDPLSNYRAEELQRMIDKKQALIAGLEAKFGFGESGMDAAYAKAIAWHNRDLKKYQKRMNELQSSPEQHPEPEPSSTTTPMPINPPANPERTDDLAYLRAIIDGKSPDMLEPDTADKLIAIMERHGDAEAQDLAGRAIDAYQSAAMEATAGIR